MTGTEVGPGPDGFDPKENELLLNEINDLTAAFESIQASIKTNAKLYELKLGEYEGEISNLRKRTEAQMDDLRAKEEEIKGIKSGMEDTKGSVQKELETKDKQLTESKEQITSSKQDLNVQKEIAKGKDAEIKKLEADLSRQLGVLQNKEQELKIALSASTDAEQSKTALIENIQDLEAKLANAKASAQKMEDNFANRLKTLEEQNNSQDSMVQSKEKEITQLQNQIQSSQETVAELLGKDQNLQSKLKVLEIQLKEKQSSWEKKKGEFLADEDELTKLKQHLDDKDQQFTTEKMEWNQEREGLIQKTEATEEKLLDEISNAKDTNDILRDDIEELKARLYRSEDTKLRQEIIDVRAKSYKELMDVRLRMDITEQKAVDEMRELNNKVDVYEKERKSLRKLTVLGAKRVGSFVRFSRRRKEQK
eukprot:CAMPEP_0197246412 /NCGR_PEP_ID=MMETSP1429-20130617/10859_1 /TAXON_ID=49237 /ORGANISM="Chaetoceros  sp., Strain UNC1202" /LENGTH=422 /DNA_ID=CAMNT_0042707049 /DNA_START=53 /DNA_END=1321 /DNA_ORIENTATION=+